MCNENRLLHHSGDTPGTGIGSLSLGDEELLKVISSDAFLKQFREGMKGFSEDVINRAIQGAKYSLSSQIDDEDDPDSLCLYCEELLEDCVCEDEDE